MDFMNIRRLIRHAAALAISATAVIAAPPENPAAKDWSLEFATGAIFSNMRNSELDGYTLIPGRLVAALRLDDDSPDEGCWRGYTEFLFGATGMWIAHGPESHILGANFGPRYTFVQPGWCVQPFIESTVGFGFADSRGKQHDGQDIGLGQDFNFNFTVSSGLRIPISDDWYVKIAGFYTHYSNASLSEPRHENRAIDAIGPELSVGWRF